MNFKLAGVLVALARSTEGNEYLVSDETNRLLIEGLTLLSEDNMDNTSTENCIEKLRKEKNRIVPDCAVCASPCGRTNEYDLNDLEKEEENIKYLKTVILHSAVNIACKIDNISEIKECCDFLYKAVYFVGLSGTGVDQLVQIVIDAGKWLSHTM